MSVFNGQYKFSYYPVPKCACTSLKLLAFKIENGFDFRGFRVNGVEKHVHSFYVSLPFERSKKMERPDHFRFTVVRDPIDRMISAYSNRVLHHNELSEARIRFGGGDADLMPRPDISTFIDNLERYRAADESIRHHTDPLTAFIGHDADYFDKIYAQRELAELVKWLAERTGAAQELEHAQRGSKDIKRSDLTEEQIHRLKDFYADDYRVFGKYF